MTGPRTSPPVEGETITFQSGKLQVPHNPLIPFIEGDGTGPELWQAAVRVIDAAVEKAYRGDRRLRWIQVYAGAASFRKNKSWLPEETVSAFRRCVVGIKGPLAAPGDGSLPSVDGNLRQTLDLYASVRRLRWFSGAPSPVNRPEKVNMVIFRESTEDIYAGIELPPGSEEDDRFLALFKDSFPQRYAKIRFPSSSGIGIKPISREGSERLVRAAIGYALANGRRSVTLVHKGNIQKFTEGAFRSWGYALAEREFGDKVYAWTRWEKTKAAKGEEAANEEQKAALASGKILIKDAIADITLQQVLTRPDEFDVIAAPSLNGDYVSYALAAQVGGIGIAPSGSFNFETGHAVFDSVYDTMPEDLRLAQVNPAALILSGEMMLRYMGWAEAADHILRGLEGAIACKTVTADLARHMEAAKEVSAGEFAEAVVANM